VILGLWWLTLLLLTSCISREEVEAEAWLQSGLPANICKEHPELGRYGLYRILNSGQTEFQSYCAQIPNTDGTAGTHNAVADYTAFLTKKLQELLDKNLPKPKESQ
jgi:hypothetical protein